MTEKKTAIITGANRGIGKSIATTFAQNNVDLILLARQEGSLDTLAKELADTYKIEVHPFYVDLSDFESLKSTMKQIVKVSKKIDILVNNAGILKGSLIGLITENDLLDTFSINCFSPMLLMQFATRLMMRQKKGSIINIVSIMGAEGKEGLSVYSGSKAAMIGMTKSAAKELAVHNIRVNAIAPGFIETDMATTIDESLYQERIESIKMKRIGSPEEVAQTVWFLGSDQSTYITGQVIGVDGGMVI